jgi:triacylglycerol esterase/lipase EstA (alpha/beta hydrolase family)
MGDIQLSAQYVVAAIRTMHAAAHRRISIIGYSQGGMVPRWALKFWPDTRAMVEDMIGIDASNHGTLDTVALCLAGCAPALWQQQFNSHFLAVLNAGQETYSGISYTQVYSADDEVVVPNLGPAASSALHTGSGAIANVSVQSICPLHVADHLLMGTVDPVGYAVVSDALSHAGPAEAARIPPKVCAELLIPGVNAATAPLNLVKLGIVIGQQLALYPYVSREPALASYTH